MRGGFLRGIFPLHPFLHSGEGGGWSRAVLSHPIPHFLTSSAPFSQPGMVSYGSADGNGTNGSSPPSLVGSTNSTLRRVLPRGRLRTRRAANPTLCPQTIFTTFFNDHIRTWSKRGPSRYGNLNLKAKSARVRRNGSGPAFSISREERVVGFL